MSFLTTLKDASLFEFVRARIDLRCFGLEAGEDVSDFLAMIFFEGSPYRIFRQLNKYLIFLQGVGLFCTFCCKQNKCK